MQAKQIETEWDIILRPRNKWYDIDLKGVWHYRDLIRLFVRRDFVAQYKQTLLGPLWIIVQPLITTIFYALIFGRIAKLPTEGLPPALFIMPALIAWTYFTDCINKTSNTFSSNANIFGKVYFPRLVAPVSVIISNLFNFLIQLVLVIFLLAYYYFYQGIKITPDYHIIFFPLFILILAGMGLATGLIVSSMTTRYRDLSFFIGFFIQFLMYASSVVFSFNNFSPQLKEIIKWNPFVWIIEGFRYSLLGTGVWSWMGILYATVFMLVLLFFSVIMFSKAEKTFMDTV